MTKEEFQTAMEAYGKKDKLFELRFLNTRYGTISGYFNDVDRAYSEICRYRNETVYFSLNELDERLRARSNNHLTRYAKHTTKDNEIINYSFLHIDCDPVRPAGIQATDSERSYAKERLYLIIDFLSDAFTFPEPIVVFSGNGYTADYYLEELPNTRENTRLIFDVLESLSELFSDDVVQADTSVGNPSRIIKVPGTISKKGDETATRRYGVSELVSVPQEHIEVRRDQLGAVAILKEEN